MWTLELQVEKSPKLLQEYGRVVILITNVEYFLKNRIHEKTGKRVEERTMLGPLIEMAKFLPKKLILDLNKLHDRRNTIIHGTVAYGFNSKTKKMKHMILKNNKEYSLNLEFLKRTSSLGRKILQNLIDFK